MSSSGCETADSRGFLPGMRFSQGPCTTSYALDKAAELDCNKTDAFDNPISIIGKFSKRFDCCYTQLPQRSQGHTEASYLVAKPHRPMQDVPRSPDGERSSHMVGGRQLVSTHCMIDDHLRIII